MAIGKLPEILTLIGNQVYLPFVRATWFLNKVAQRTIDKLTAVSNKDHYPPIPVLAWHSWYLQRGLGFHNVIEAESQGNTSLTARVLGGILILSHREGNVCDRARNVSIQDLREVFYGKTLTITIFPNNFFSFSLHVLSLFYHRLMIFHLYNCMGGTKDLLQVVRCDWLYPGWF